MKRVKKKYMGLDRYGDKEVLKFGAFLMCQDIWKEY